METMFTLRYATLIAAYNEADQIQDTVITASLVPGIVGVIVADDGSTDDTAEKAARAGAVVVSNKHNLGKGQAMELAATTLEKIRPFGEVDGVVLLDGDVGTSASCVIHLLDAVATAHADLAIGVLPSPPNKAGIGMVKSLARDAIIEFGDGFVAEAPLSGQRALTLDCLHKVRPFADGYAMEVDMTIKALRQKLCIKEVPVEMKHRYSGRNLSGFIHRGKQYSEISKLINSYYKKNKK